MGFVWALGRCWSCGALFGFDPDRVPSVPIDPATNTPPDMGGDAARAVRQPVCAACIERANDKRRASGEPLIMVLPGAYEPREDG